MTSGVDSSARRSPLVDVEWLAAHRGELVLLHASISRTVDEKSRTVFGNGQHLFERSHVPGAQIADLFDGFSDPDGRFLFTRPSAACLERAARAVGIDDDSTVVVYDAMTGAWAARVWWVLRSFGLDTVYVLNGGLDAWIRSGRQTATGPTIMPQRPGTFHARERRGFYVDIDAVKPIALRPDGAQDSLLICGVRRAEYLGRGSFDPRAGHIPHSVSLPYPDLLDENGMITVERVRSVLADANIKLDRKLILYCGGGINASGLALALAEAGHAGMTIYDGSLNEWRADPSLPMATGADEAVLG